MPRMRTIGAGLAIVVFLSAWIATGTALAFPDVPDSHRYARAINELAQLGVVSGRDDGSFRPDDPVNRAQFAKMMCGLLEIGVSEDQSFAPFIDLGPDDPGDLYPHEFVGAAYRAGITKGKTTKGFGPYASITLAQVITMVVRAADAYHPGLLATPQSDWWGWWPGTDPTHGPNIRRADYTDLLAHIPTQGPSTDVFRPATRGEVSQILANLRQELEGVNITVSFEGTPLDLQGPLYVVNNRYYLPLTEIVERMGGIISIRGGSATVELNSTSITLDTTTGSYTLNGAPSTLRQSAIVTTRAVYLSLFDLHKMLALKVDWDEAGGTIGLFRNRDTLVENRQPVYGRPALVRFEDVTATQRYASAESLEKLRIVFDYCWSKGIPMHLGWVPRYVDPMNGIDNAPADDYSMHNADFVYTLDYFVDRGGLIGLHGYTHQYGSQVSIDSSEFDDTHNTSATVIRGRLRHALDDAAKLGIPIAFFESPHYAALPSQKAIIGEYFDVIYEHRLSARETRVTKVNVGSRVVTFVPTPLNGIDGVLVDTDAMIAKMRSLAVDDLASFFYHPDFEFSFISLDDGGGYPGYSYASASPLQRVLDAFLEEGFTFVSVDSL
jgi:hypothetical protein